MATVRDYLETQLQVVPAVMLYRDCDTECDEDMIKLENADSKSLPRP